MKMKREQLIRKLVDKKVEGEYWDYKEKWHIQNERLIHDILCFVNTIHNKDCYIIIGVSDDGEVKGVEGDENRKKQADVLDLLANTMFAGDSTPEVQLSTILIDNQEVDIITVKNSFAIPYYLKSKSKRYQNIREGYIYTRTRDRNTPINQNATVKQIEMLWKKRLGLTLPPLNQIEGRLNYKNEWVQNGDIYYNIYTPEFKLVQDNNWEDNNRLKGEFYVYSQVNSSFSYVDLKVMYDMTILEEFQLVVLDSGRYKTPVPEWGFIGYDEWGIHHKYTYKYYLRDSMVYKLQQFFFDEEDMEETHAKSRLDEIIIYYDDEIEKRAFESYVESNQDLVEVYIKEADKWYYSIDSINKLEVNDAREKLSIGIALNRILKEYRIK